MSRPDGCKCSMAKYAVGDGCDICNPALGLAYAKETIANLEGRIAELEAQLAEVDPALIAFRNVFYRYAPEGVECSERLHNAYKAAAARQQARKANP